MSVLSASAGRLRAVMAGKPPRRKSPGQDFVATRHRHSRVKNNRCRAIAARRRGRVAPGGAMIRHATIREYQEVLAERQGLSR